MSEKNLRFRVGLGAIALSLSLFVYFIPFWVVTPSNVPEYVMSPLFWPIVISLVTIVTGILLVASSFRADDTVTVEDVNRKEGVIRLVLTGIIMLCIFLATPRLGMVLTCMLGFLAAAFVLRMRLIVVTFTTALLLPLFLYFFFEHIVGVGIPQGDYLRLP